MANQLYQYRAIYLGNDLYALYGNEGTKSQPNWVSYGDDDWTRDDIEEYILEDGEPVAQVKYIVLDDLVY